MLSDPCEHHIHFTPEDLFKQCVFQVTAGEQDGKDGPALSYDGDIIEAIYHFLVL